MSNKKLEAEKQKIRHKYQKKREEIKTNKDYILYRISTMAKEYLNKTGKKLSKHIVNLKKNEVTLTARVNLMKLTRQEANEVKRAAIRYKLIGSSVAAAGIIAASVRAHYVINQELEDRCKRYKTKKERDLCKLKIKRSVYEKKLEFLNDLIIGCKKSKDPVKCELRVQQYMFKLQDKIDALKRKYVLSQTGMWGE